jgi:membrane dipeptidase
VIDLVGPEHVGIGSDLRGISKYSEGFGSEANFYSIIEEMAMRGHDKSTIGNVMGGNFFRLWQKVAD